ncbi:DUF4440 domain-containing protein [Bowmanella sp. Y26]|uniref:YybH family protein n=1 Tax=Bowmanella yangjiangensis TaxID=2811230 RepID=UPI001BDC56B1|nr:nuclear transport factor 2 family protein [Bowmanella yangjiangensis]MBT1062325.1 DUF4440 domain-containing protein [Bowmanella yangjiangensis]
MTDQKQLVHASIERMTKAFAQGDLDTILSSYTAEAVIAVDPSQPVTGSAALRAMFSEYIKAGVAFTYGNHEVVVSGNTALHLMKWTAPQPDGSSASALSVAVLHRQPDGQWKMVIDHPFGDNVMQSQ